MRKYSIGEISEMTGLSRRTIRYYLQRGLIPSPHGAGRGRYYTEDHLARIRKIIDLQSKGMFLDEIARRLTETGEERPELSERFLAGNAQRLPGTMASDTHGADLTGACPELAEPAMADRKSTRMETWIKVSLAEGVELSVREDIAMLMGERMDRIADAVGGILAEAQNGELSARKKKGDKDGK